MPLIDDLAELDDNSLQWWKLYIIVTLQRCVSYNRQDLFDAWVTAVGGSALLWQAENDTELSGIGIVGNRRTAFVCFQGTRDLQQLYQQIFQSPQVTDEVLVGGVHAYYAAVFHRQLEMVKPVLEGQVRNSDVLFCGSSAGGAIAQLFTFYYSGGQWVQTKGTVTTGQPRVSGPAMRNAINAPYIRLVGQNDFVTALPPQSFVTDMLIGPLADRGFNYNYSHVVQGWLMFEDGTNARAESGIVPRGWGPNPLPFLSLPGYLALGLDAHSVPGYIARLRPRCTRQGYPIDLGPFDAINAQFD